MWALLVSDQRRGKVHQVAWGELGRKRDGPVGEIGLLWKRKKKKKENRSRESKGERWAAGKRSGAGPAAVFGLKGEKG
jgi:hypothetical protein